MKKVVLCLLVAVAVTGVVCEENPLLESAKAFGEFAGAAAAYALHSDSVDEFTENMAEHEYKSENLQEAQEDTSEIIDAVTDAYIDLTSDDEEE